jgi:hypothetical protein
LGLYYGLGRTFFNPASVSFLFYAFCRSLLGACLYLQQASFFTFLLQAKVFSRFDALRKAVKNYTIEATPDDRSGVLQQV